MADGYRFIDIPAYAAVSINNEKNVTPDNIYEQAVAFRGIYEKSKPLSKKVSVPNGFPIPVDEWRLIHNIPQSLVVQLALSNELLLKAVLLGSTGKLETGHSLKSLINKLDRRYVKYIKQHLINNNLSDGKWDNVIKSSDKIFITARYGYEVGNYKIDFMTLQLINEALDDIYNNKLPVWWDIKEILDKDNKKNEEIKRQVDLIFDEKYQAQQKLELEEFEKVFNDYSQEKVL